MVEGGSGKESRWRTDYDENYGRHYYVDKRTNESTWETPDDL